MKNHWLDKKEYPFRSNYFDINGCKLHYIDQGVGETLVFVHGTPSWSFDFRNIIKALEIHYRCLAIDHIGFGLSEKPEDYNYSTQNHSKTFEQFVLGLDLNNITLIVHDFGGPIGINFAIRHPEKIKKIVVLNSWLWSSGDDPVYLKIHKILKSPLIPLLYRYFNFSAKFILPRTFGDHKLTKHQLRQYTKPFAKITQRNGPLAFARSLVNDQEWFEKLWRKRKVISGKPALLIWGMKDPVLNPENLYRFATCFIHSKVIEIESSGHFPQEEQPELVANAICEFIEA